MVVVNITTASIYSTCWGRCCGFYQSYWKTHGRALKRMDANSSAWMRTLTHGRALTVPTGFIYWLIKEWVTECEWKIVCCSIVIRFCTYAYDEIVVSRRYCDNYKTENNEAWWKRIYLQHRQLSTFWTRGPRHHDTIMLVVLKSFWLTPVQWRHLPCASVCRPTNYAYHG